MGWPWQEVSNNSVGAFLSRHSVLLLPIPYSFSVLIHFTGGPPFLSLAVIHKVIFLHSHHMSRPSQSATPAIQSCLTQLQSLLCSYQNSHIHSHYFFSLILTQYRLPLCYLFLLCVFYIAVAHSIPMFDAWNSAGRIKQFLVPCPMSMFILIPFLTPQHIYYMPALHISLHCLSCAAYL